MPFRVSRRQPTLTRFTTHRKPIPHQPFTTAYRESEFFLQARLRARAFSSDSTVQHFNDSTFACACQSALCILHSALQNRAAFVLPDLSRTVWISPFVNMFWSQLLIPTLKEVPSDAEI